MTENELQRGARRRLAIIRHAQEVSHNVQKTCRYYGISRSCYYRWLERYNAEGEAGVRERSRGPIHSPTATSDEVVAKILYLRQHYHFGPQKIAMYLARYHDIEVSTSCSVLEFVFGHYSSFSEEPSVPDVRQFFIPVTLEPKTAWPTMTSKVTN